MVTPSATTTYTVTVADNCSTPVARDPMKVVVNPLPTVSFSVSDSSGCAPLCVQFEDHSTAANGSISAWNWNFNGTTSTEQNPINCFNSPSTYSVTLTATSLAGCENSKTFSNLVTIFPDPVAEFDMDSEGSSSIPVSFTDQSTGATSWFWTFGDKDDTTTSTLQNPTHLYSDTGTFCATLVVKTSNGCEATTEHCVIIHPESSLYIPNSFTPDGNGKNDIFYAKGRYIKEFKMIIFDRWGLQIFSSDDIKRGWDGKVKGRSELAQQDVYIYKLIYTDLTDNKYESVGTVTVLR
jgi:gliding motility-associated-like protein